MLEIKNISKNFINFFFNLFGLRIISENFYKKSLKNKGNYIAKIEKIGSVKSAIR